MVRRDLDGLEMLEMLEMLAIQLSIGADGQTAGRP
jgi:hypothetical protein